MSPEPPKHVDLGTGGLHYIEWASRNFEAEKFREFYEHRALHLANLHKDTLTDEARAALVGVIPVDEQNKTIE